MSVRSRRGLAAGTVAGGLLLLAAAPSGAQSACIEVRGSYIEHAVSGPDCTSPVGLCIAGEYSGGIRGAFEGAATTVTGSADTPSTNVLFFTSDSTIQARVRGRSGTLSIKNAGTFSTADGGPIVDLQTIVGGTGALSGASGSLRAQGTFSATSGGTSHYEWTVCLP
jgi:hypothetical protein